MKQKTKGVRKDYEKMVFQCSCGEHKYLNISVFHWDNEPTDYYMYITYEPYGLIYRLKKAWEVFWKGGTATHEIVFDRGDWKRLSKFFKDHYETHTIKT